MYRISRVILGLLIILEAFSWCASQETYFPPDVFGKGKWAKTEHSLNSFFLKRLEEPSLYTKAKDKSAETYRFLWLRTFHNPVAVRLNMQTDGTSLLTVKTADGHSGFPRTVTKLAQTTSRTLSRDETKAFLDKVRTVGFWKEKSRDSGSPAATDGDGWILEGVAGGNYHVVSRVIPNTLPKNTIVVQALGKMLAFELGRIDIAEEER